MTNDLVYRLRKRAEIRRQISTRKSVQEGKPDRISDLIEEAADALEKREWVGLTDEEIWDCYTDQGKKFYLAIEAKLKEKNT
jgi:N6-adenosine-specific RNA methylase IME4